MRLLLDECVWKPAREVLREKGHDVAVVADRSGMEDPDILKLAFNEQRILITPDNDFGRLSVVEGQLHFGIVRLVDVHAHEQAA